MMTRRTALLLALALPTAFAHAAPGDCVTGTPQTISSQPNGQFPIAYMTPTLSGATVVFYVRDANGQALKDIDVEVTTPAAKPTAALWVDELTAAPDPRRLVVRTDAACKGTVNLVGDDATGTFAVTLRVVANPSVAEPMMISQAPATFTATEAQSTGTVVRTGSPHVTPRVQLRSNRGNFGSAPVRFEAPVSGGSGRFANGTRSIIVNANAFGIALAPMTAGDTVGEFTVQATPDGFGTGATLGPYVNVRDTTLALGTGPAEFTFGTSSVASGTVRFAGLPCRLLESVGAYAPAHFSFRIDNIAYASNLGMPSNCSPTEVAFSRDIGTWPFGTHELVPDYAGPAVFDAVRGNAFRFTVLPAFQGATPAGNVKVGVGATGFADDLGACHLKSARVATLGSAGMPAAAPANTTLPHGLLAFEIDACSFASGTGALRRPGVQRMLLEFDAALPAGSAVFAFNATAADPTPRWRELPATILGNRALVRLANGGDGDDTPSTDEFIRGVLAIGVKGATLPANYADIWWAGAAENGWGLTISQHGDKLFIALFIYDAAGKARWLVLPAGGWNAGFTAYSGALYRPRGSFYRNYSAAAFSAGEPVGTMTVTFTGNDTATLAYTIDGVSATKTIRRQGFSANDPVPIWRFDDLWWGGGSQNGWGVAIAQQFSALFAVWFTYDENGETTWFVIPEGRMTGDFSFFGTAYSTRGSQWLGATYNPAAFVATKFSDVQIFFRSRESAQLRLLDPLLQTTFSLEMERQPF